MITSPTQISNCQVWLDASDTSTLYTEISGRLKNCATVEAVGAQIAAFLP